MSDGERANAMARWMWDARRRRLPYRNLPDELRPASIAEAYAAQEAYYRLAEPVYGAVGGAKIATTTKVMQRLMGIDHPCGGAIFARTIHRFAGAAADRGFRQFAPRKRDRAEARRRPAGIGRAVDARGGGAGGRRAPCRRSS